MFKIFAFILVSAVCMSPAAEAASAAVAADASTVQTLNPNLIDYYGYQVGLPLLAPDNGPLTNIMSAALPPRTYIAQSNPVLYRTPGFDQFIGQSTLGIVVI